MPRASRGEPGRTGPPTKLGFRFARRASATRWLQALAQRTSSERVADRSDHASFAYASAGMTSGGRRSNLVRGKRLRRSTGRPDLAEATAQVRTSRLARAFGPIGQDDRLFRGARCNVRARACTHLVIPQTITGRPRCPTHSVPAPGADLAAGAWNARLPAGRSADRRAARAQLPRRHGEGVRTRGRRRRDPARAGHRLVARDRPRRAPIVHGLGDIGATIALIAAPFVLGYSDHAVATVFSIVVGVGGLGATLLTRFVSDLVTAQRVAVAPAA
jgi:hypothetical protein